jgi:hypothetical protein
VRLLGEEGGFVVADVGCATSGCSTTSRSERRALDAVNIAPPNSSLGRGGESLLMERVSWIMKNCPLPEIETYKDGVNSPWWGGIDHSRLRNQLRSLFEERLHACPVLQTNPYETVLRDGR